MSGALKPYPKYKESGVEWLGAVPEGWTSSPLKHLVRETLQYGAGELATSDDENDPRYIRITDIADDGSLKTEEIRRLPWESAQPYLLEDDDLLVARSGTVGRSFMYRSSMGVACFAGYLIRVRPDPNRLYPSFLWHVFHSQYFWDFIAQSQVNTTIANVNATRYGQLPLPLPPLPEQQAITDYLDAETQRIDTLIAELREMIWLLKEKRQALISHCVTKGLDPTVPMKDSGVEWLGEVPEGWEVVPMKYAITYLEGPGILANDFFEEGVPLIRVSGVRGDTVTLEGCNFLDSQVVASRWSHFRLRKGDLLISASASTGVIAEVDEQAEGAIPYTGLIILREINGITRKDFVRWFFQSRAFLTQIDLMKSGSTIQHFGPTHLSRALISLPDIDKQEEIATHLDRETAKIDRLIAETEETITLMQERRSALISSVVTGKLQVPGIPSPSGSTLNSRPETLR